MLRTILLVAPILVAQDVSLHGTVKTSTDIPLGGVVVTLASSSTVADTTDANGVFHLARTSGGTGLAPRSTRRSPITATGSGIVLSLDEAAPTSVALFSPDGKCLAEPWNRTLPSGRHFVPLRPEKASMRLLLVRVRIGDAEQTLRFLPGRNALPGASAPAEAFRTLDQAETAHPDTLVFSRTDLGTLRMPIQSTTLPDTIKARTTSVSGTLSDSGTGSGGMYKVGIYANNWYLDWGTGSLVASTILPAAGPYRIDKFLPSGDYYLMAYRDADGDSSYTDFGDPADPMNEYSLDPVSIGAAGLSGADIRIVPRTITGKVSDAPEGWRISASGPENEAPTTRIEADGSYRLTVYRQGIYGIFAYDPNSAATVAYAHNPIDLTEPVRSVGGIDLSVPRNVTISGTLTDLGKDSVGLYKIALFTNNWYMDGVGGRVVASLLTGQTGKYTITATIPEGRYYLMAYRDVDMDGSYTYSGMAVDPMGEHSPEPVEITSQGLSGADITIVPRFLSGKVSGAPSGWQVRATGPGVDRPTTTIAPDGSYALNLYRPGIYTVTAFDPKGATQLPYPNPVDLTGANTTARGIDLAVGSPITFSGTIRDSSADPSGPYKIALFSSNWYWDWGSNTPVASATIPSAGPYTMTGIVPSGKYFLMVYHDADGNRSFTNTGDAIDPMGEYSAAAVSIGGGDFAGADIAIVPRTVSGKVVGVPSGWKVRARGPGVDEPTAVIAADGTYTLKLYRSASYSITAFDPAGAATIDYARNPVDLTGSSRSATNIDIAAP